MELLEIEKVRITAHDEMGVGREGTGKDGVVVGIGVHDVPDAGGFSPLGEPWILCDQLGSSAPGQRKTSRELCAAENVAELGDERIARVDFDAFLFCCIDQTQRRSAPE